MYDELKEEIYVEKSFGCVAQGSMRLTDITKLIMGICRVLEHGLKSSDIDLHRIHCNHYVFIKKSDEQLAVLVAYVEDIILFGSDTCGILTTNL